MNNVSLEKYTTWKNRLSWLYRLLDNPYVYSLNQKVAAPTKRRHFQALHQSMTDTKGKRILEIACGVGDETYPDAFLYCGTDLNHRSVTFAARSNNELYAAMDCTRLGFADDSFDHVISIATMHHLGDTEVTAMISESLRVCRPGGSVHIVDNIFPVSPIKSFKKFWFSIDRGRHPRSQENLAAAIGHRDITTIGDVITGPLHDVVFFRLTPHEACNP
jgi:SAM-dependent methyltransferase